MTYGDLTVGNHFFTINGKDEPVEYEITNVDIQSHTYGYGTYVVRYKLSGGGKRSSNLYLTKYRGNNDADPIPSYYCVYGSLEECKEIISDMLRKRLAASSKSLENLTKKLRKAKEKHIRTIQRIDEFRKNGGNI